MRFLGKVFLLLLLLVAAFVAYGFWQGPILDAQSKAYVDTAVPAIFTRWNKAELVSRASPEFTQIIKDGDLNSDFFGVARRLGVLVHCDGTTGNSQISINEKGLSITAQYQVKAQFYTAPALIQVSLIKHGDQWQILGCHIDSRAFAPLFNNNYEKLPFLAPTYSHSWWICAVAGIRCEAMAVPHFSQSRCRRSRNSESNCGLTFILTLLQP